MAAHLHGDGLPDAEGRCARARVERVGGQRQRSRRQDVVGLRADVDELRDTRGEPVLAGGLRGGPHADLLGPDPDLKRLAAITVSPAGLRKQP